eukprot:m.10119 g.10119  ORF g.10119 m.10119 type:complete len:319 (+) comp8134_c0_seq1:159-1115(+)
METPACRIPYIKCPFCSAEVPSGGWQGLLSAPCHVHPSFSVGLPPVQTWVRCPSCQHIFTNGYFNDAALTLIFSKSLPHQIFNVESVEQGRFVSAPMVEKVSALRGSSEGAWLDVGTGNGALFTTAAEFGYAATGIDSRLDPVKALNDLGYDARCVPFEKMEEKDGSFDVISMADVLEHLPWPREALQKVKQLLRPNGIVFLSMPNYDCLGWRVMDKTGSNPYWGEIEHFHNFSRQTLTKLLAEYNFKVVHYEVSRRYRACMELIAVKLPEVETAHTKVAASAPNTDTQTPIASVQKDIKPTETGNVDVPQSTTAPEM